MQETITYRKLLENLLSARCSHGEQDVDRTRFDE